MTDTAADTLPAVLPPAVGPFERIPAPLPRGPGVAEFEHLLDKLRGTALPRPTGWHVLVLQYVRPERVGSIILSGKTLQEDAWQNRVGLVLAVGPDCWADRARYPTGPWASPGDGVMWRKLDNAASRFEVNGATLCFVNDDAVIASGIVPSKVVG
jgi:hypothetical protein